MSGPFYAMKLPLGVGNTTRHDDIYYEQRKIITNIADREIRFYGIIILLLE